MKPYYDKDGISIYCGEALEVLDDLELSASMILTDPPYSSGGMYRGDRMGSVKEKYVSSGTVENRPEYGGDNRDQRGYLAWCSLWLSKCYRISAPGAVLAVFSDWRQLPTMTDAIQCGGFVWRGIYVWDKTPASRPRLGCYRAQTEYIPWGTAGPAPVEGVAGNGLWRGLGPRGDRFHQAEKPLALIEDLLAICPPDGIVLDLFMGSGTTLLAAKRLGLKAVGIEIEEHYCEVAVKRLATTQKLLAFGGPTE